MKLLSLDISTKTGWAVFTSSVVNYNVAQLHNYGRIDIVDKNIDQKIDYKNFNNQTMQAIFKALGNFYSSINRLVDEYYPDIIVIEQTNLGRQRISQKVLEWLHLIVCLIIVNRLGKFPIFIDSSDWRKTVGLRLSKEDKEHNKLIKKQGKRGKINKKHLALRIVNEKFKKRFSTPLKVKDNDIADAICLGVAWLNKNGYSI